jgi:hypothetical protein
LFLRRAKAKMQFPAYRYGANMAVATKHLI